MLPSLSLAAKLPGQLGDLATLCPAVCELWQSVQVRNSEAVGKWGQEKEEGRRGPAQWRQGKEDAEVSWESTLSQSVKRPCFQSQHNPATLPSKQPGTRDLFVLTNTKQSFSVPF